MRLVPSSWRHAWPLAFVLFASGTGCVPTPTLSAFAPGSGYPRQLLAVQGTTLFASIVWDVGQPTETVLQNGLFGTNYFQIPATATPGVHAVAMRNSRGTSAPQNVTVLAASGAFPAPLQSTSAQLPTWTKRCPPTSANAAAMRAVAATQSRFAMSS